MSKKMVLLFVPMLLLSFDNMFAAGEAIDILNNIGTGSLNNATAIMSGPIGSVAFMLIAIAILGLIIMGAKKLFGMGGRK